MRRNLPGVRSPCAGPDLLQGGAGVVGEAAVEVVADPFEAGGGALLLELAELPDDRLGEGVADRVAVPGGVLEQPVEQFEQVQAYLFRIG